MLYHYRAINPLGQLITGQLRAANPDELARLLQARDCQLLRQRPSFSWRRQHLPRRELINLCFQLEQLLAAGVPLLEALSDLQGTGSQPLLAQCCGELHTAIANGKSLSEAIEAASPVFPASFASMIRAGESAGHLPQALASLGKALRTEDELHAQTKRLLLYPAFVGGVVLAATAFLMIYLVPQLKQLLRQMGQTLPLHSRALFALAEALPDIAFWLAITALPLGILLAAAYQRIGRFRLQLDRTSLHLPWLGQIWQKILLARFATNLAMLYAAGIPILAALEISAGVVSNRALRDALRNSSQAVAEGSGLAEAFASNGAFPTLVVRMLRIGENTGRLDAALNNVDYFFQRDVSEAVERLQVLIEPVMTVLLGLLLGWVMMSMLGPIYQVIGSIRP